MRARLTVEPVRNQIDLVRDDALGRPRSGCALGSADKAAAPPHQQAVWWGSAEDPRQSDACGRGQARVRD